MWMDPKPIVSPGRHRPYDTPFVTTATGTDDSPPRRQTPIADAFSVLPSPATLHLSSPPLLEWSPCVFSGSTDNAVLTVQDHDCKVLPLKSERVAGGYDHLPPRHHDGR